MQLFINSCRSAQYPHQMGTTPSWSYDMADDLVKEEAIRRILSSVTMFHEVASATLNNRIIPALERVESNERSSNRTPTGFLEEIERHVDLTLKVG